MVSEASWMASEASWMASEASGGSERSEWWVRAKRVGGGERRSELVWASEASWLIGASG